MKIRIILFVILSLTCFSCGTRCPYLEGRARRQLPVSIEYDLGNFKDKEIQDLKTVYVNDSICLLQCRLKYVDNTGEVRFQDMRYTYLIDFMESHYRGKAIYKENFEFIACMPDEYIIKNRERADAKGESVYEYMYGGTYPIRQPFDEKQ